LSKNIFTFIHSYKSYKYQAIQIVTELNRHETQIYQDFQRTYCNFNKTLLTLHIKTENNLLIRNVIIQEFK
jgi:hypothetical protein